MRTAAMSSKAMAFAIISAAATSPSSLVSAFHYSALSPMSSTNVAAPSSSHRSFQLDYAAGNNNNFSELDKLRAKRLSLRRPSPSSQVATSGPIKDLASSENNTQQRGLEYLYDQTQERHDDDFFHVILMPSTFTKNQVSIEHSTTTLLTALSTTPNSSNNSHRLTYEKAHKLSLYTKHQGFGVIGTWTREDCLQIGEMLRKEGLDCRVIPFNSALPSSSLIEGEKRGVPTASDTSSSPSLEHQVKMGEKQPVVKVRSSTSGASYSSDYLLSLSP